MLEVVQLGLALRGRVVIELGLERAVVGDLVRCTLPVRVEGSRGILSSGVR